MLFEHNIWKLQVSNKTLLRVLVVIATVFALIHLADDLVGPLLMVGIAVFLSLALGPLTGWFDRLFKLKNRLIAVGAAMTVVLVGVGTLLSLVLPALIYQTKALIEALPGAIEGLQSAESGIGGLVNRMNLVDSLGRFSDNLADGTISVSDLLIGFTPRAVVGTVSALAVILLTALILAQGPTLFERFVKQLPLKKRAKQHSLLLDINNIFTRYVAGQFVLALLLSVVSYVLLRIFSIDFALSLAALSFFIGLLPLIGNPLVGVILVIAALAQSTGTGVAMLVVYLIYQQIENIFIQPKVHAKAVHIPPMFVIISAMSGAILAGLFGALVAIPIAASIRLVILDYYKRRKATLSAS